MSAGDPFHIVEIPARNLGLTELNERCRVLGWSSEAEYKQRENRHAYMGWLAMTDHALGASCVVVSLSPGIQGEPVKVWVEKDEAVLFMAAPPEPTTTPAHFGQN